jgi:ribosome biogenesis GTPase
VRTLRPDTDEQTLAASFADIEALAAHCRFRDCSHHDEPDCAVRAGVDADRLKNFQKMLRDARRDSMNVLERQAVQAKWKAIGKSTRAWMKIKRGQP